MQWHLFRLRNTLPSTFILLNPRIWNAYTFLAFFEIFMFLLKFVSRLRLRPVKITKVCYIILTSTSAYPKFKLLLLWVAIIKTYPPTSTYKKFIIAIYEKINTEVISWIIMNSVGARGNRLAPFHLEHRLTSWKLARRKRSCITLLEREMFEKSSPVSILAYLSNGKMM
jgi:hypothetical protein